MRAFPPLPIRDDWAPKYLHARAEASNRDFAFTYADPQGMPSWSGLRFHGAVDWFAPGGTMVCAPGPGRVVRVSASRGNSGQVFGGVVTIEQDDGICWVMRHVDPMCVVGADVSAGDPMARVTDWRDGGDHLHLEVWKSLAGGYRWENCINPSIIEWTVAVLEAPEPGPDLYFEELPARKGGTGPDVVGKYKWASYAATARALRRARGERVSTLAADDGWHYVLRWAKGTHGRKFRFGPWAAGTSRQDWLDRRQESTGRTQRAFDGRANSFYPYVKESVS